MSESELVLAESDDLLGRKEEATGQLVSNLGEGEGILEPMELAHLPYKKGRTYEDYVGLRGLKRLGKKKWNRHVEEVVKQLKIALEAGYVVLGGGNAKLLKKLPPGARLGDNNNAFRGGFRLWRVSKRHVARKLNPNRLLTGK